MTNHSRNVRPIVTDITQAQQQSSQQLRVYLTSKESASLQLFLLSYFVGAPQQVLLCFIYLA
jgi:hypothetical protein